MTPRSSVLAVSLASCVCPLSRGVPTTDVFCGLCFLVPVVDAWFPTPDPVSAIVAQRETIDRRRLRDGR